MKIPYLADEIILEYAEKFRKDYWNDSLPVDIEKIIENSLGLEIIPIPQLRQLCDADALITSNWLSIYVDNDCYSDDRYYNRLRFSLAHEVGHLVLHKELYGDFGIDSVKKFYSFIEKIESRNYSYLEIQANKFAGFLLIPFQKLDEARNEFFERNKGLVGMEPSVLNPYIADDLSDIFGVSPQSLEISLKNTHFKDNK